ncbi:glycosyltransferase family 2 protein [Methylomonas fluvii]|uniref:Glycosyltransferase family 2 protein n=1 Tax=Methylomonas fluvii TaxID=1854564 RepID=A0ABR9D9T2_9GAMM|nr:glycosyltransferase family A protein [Methylomonas fluvii]MBD9359867.1 glycosyltransferase family 2 protein [Methylomonas fluvii]
MITVVVPLYNKASTIERAINSVLVQTVENWELIVVDDGSEDQGAELVSRYNDKRIRLIRQKNSGVATARNVGAKAANSSVLAFLDADDYWATTHLENLEKLITEYPEAVLYGSAYFGVGEDGVARKIKFSGIDELPIRLLITDYFMTVVENGYFLFTSSVAIKKEIFEDLGGFPVGVKSGEDTLTWARLACQGDVAYTKVATSYYMLPNVSLGERKNFLRRPQIPDYVGSELIKLLDSSIKNKMSLQKYIAYWHRIRAMIFLELNERANGYFEIWKAISHDHVKLKDILCCILLLLPLNIRAYFLFNIRKMRGRA